MGLRDIAKLAQNNRVLRVISKYGVERSRVEEVKLELAWRRPDQGQTYYYYNGPLDDKTRPFCRLMLQIDKVFSQEDIDKISEELGYSVLEYCGSFGCRHQWVKFRGKFITTPKPTVMEIRKLINDGDEFENK